MGGGGAQSRVECQIADLIALGQASLNVTAAFTIGFRAGATTGLLARQAIELSVKTTWRELLRAADLLTTLPPVRIVWCLRYRLWSGLLLGDFSSVSDFLFLA